MVDVPKLGNVYAAHWFSSSSNGVNELASLIDSAIAEAFKQTRAARGEWQPISTAPSRAPFLATGKTETPCVVTTTDKIHRELGYKFCCYHTQTLFHESKFTHWIPLPAQPPAQGGVG